MKNLIVCSAVVFLFLLFAAQTARAFEDHLLPSGYLVDVRDFGALGNGYADDTNAIQAAVNSIRTKGGDILMRGNFNSNAIKFPSITQWIRIHLDGSWKLKFGQTLVIPPFVWINGRGGTGITTQGTLKPQAAISATHSAPVVRMTGSGPKGMSNMMVINNGSGPAILLQSGILFTLENIFAVSPNAPALKLDGAVLVDIRYATFGVSPNGSAKGSVEITTTSQSPNSQSGIIDMDRCLVSSKGIVIAAERPVSDQSFMNFSSIVYESGANPFFTLDGTKGIVQYITLDKVQLADNVSVPSFIHVLGPQGSVASVSFEDSAVYTPINNSSGAPPISFVGGGSIKGLNVYIGLPTYDSKPEDLGTQKSSDTTIIRDGEFVTEFVQ